MARYPNLSVVYDGKKLMLIYLGTPIKPGRAKDIATLLQTSKLDQRYTFRLVGGFMDSQPQFWAKPSSTPTGPIEIAPKYGYWSVTDRINSWGAPPAPYYPTYNRVGARIENMTASVATPGQTGWTCKGGDHGYCADAALRYCGEGYANGCQSGDYETLAEFMSYAKQLQPIFLIIDQFNEFAMPDEGKTVLANDDLEPVTQWGYSGIRAVIDQVKAYRASYTSAAAAP
jgi:hypothetical protein